MSELTAEFTKGLRSHATCLRGYANLTKDVNPRAMTPFMVDELMKGIAALATSAEQLADAAEGLRRVNHIERGIGHG